MTVVTDPYTLTSELGCGGMATVHRLHDARYGRDVAVKVMLPRHRRIVRRGTVSPRDRDGGAVAGERGVGEGVHGGGAASLDKFVGSPVPGCARIGMLGVQNSFAELERVTRKTRQHA